MTEKVHCVLHAIWDTSSLLLWASSNKADLTPLDHAQVRAQLGDIAGDALLAETAAADFVDADLPAPGRVSIPVLRLSPSDANDLLMSLPTHLPESCADSVRFFRSLAQLVNMALSHHQVYPSLRRTDVDYVATWQPLVGGRADVEILEKFASAIPQACRCLPAIAAEHPLRVVETFLTETTDQLIRRAVANDPFFARVHQTPAAVDVRWLSALLGSSRQISGESDEVQQLFDDVHQWLAPITDAGEQANLRLRFDLHEPATDVDPWPVKFSLVSEVDEAEVLVTAEELWKQQASPLTALGRSVGDRQQKFLAELRRAMEYFPSLERAVHSEQPAEILLSPVEAFAFMRNWSDALDIAGFSVEMPPWALAEQNELSLRLSLAPADEEMLESQSGPAPSGAQPYATGGRVGLESLVQFDWRVAIGQTQLSAQEFEQLVNRQTPLVKFGNRWIQIDLDAAQKAAEAMKTRRSDKLSLAEAFRVAYGLVGDLGVPIGGLTGASWIGRLLEQSPDAKIEELIQPVDFKGELRPYQLRGLQWLRYLDRIGIGACLADDMGLGKTIQFIALLLQEREENPTIGPTLLFAPASVIGNWIRELERFAPRLKVMAHHGPLRLHNTAFADAANAHDVVLTGYALAHRDHEDFKKVLWRRIALDEAQKVKNPSSAASVAIRSLASARRVALTGTPIENHLSELWSIMETLNPGLLGSPSQFRERFVIPVEKMNDPKRGQLLREMIRPFVLRRTKQDPEVAVNLPEKMEMRVFCSLTPEQAAMYERITAEMLASVENASGIRRRGLILAGLTRLKQICDHPALLTSDNQKIENRSGKCERLIDMLEEVLEEGDAALVFTQYREMGHLLERQIEARLGRKTLFLHGGVPVKERDNMTQLFQHPDRKYPIFLLSLRAGGLGLNLTAANHVFHFDRWWNPAVEAQATDRAHRIGQNKIVQVHKFVSIGTVEERIDKLLGEKLQLAENIVTSGDQWLTGLSTDDLRKYLALSSEAVEET